MSVDLSDGTKMKECLNLFHRTTTLSNNKVLRRSTLHLREPSRSTVVMQMEENLFKSVADIPDLILKTFIRPTQFLLSSAVESPSFFSWLNICLIFKF